MSGLGFFMTGNGRTDNRVRRSPYSQKGNIGESDLDEIKLEGRYRVM